MAMKLKKSSIEAVEEEVKATGGGAFISERLRNPAQELAAQNAGRGDKIGGICAIVATVLLVIITGLLYVNWDAIKSA
ncbi:MAG: hypothetical protein PHV28_10080 [Kiritimatiellae bacterium]|nr:hypothetical protein [Kiritimatiellia bacterium]